MLVVSALPAFAPERFKYLETKASRFCCVLSLIVLCITIGDDISSARQAKAQAQAFEQRLTAAEEASRPVPVEARLRALLNRVNPRILETLADGRQRKFKVSLRASDRDELRKLCTEPRAAEYITMLPQEAYFKKGDHLMTIGTRDTTYLVGFALSTNLAVTSH